MGIGCQASALPLRGVAMPLKQVLVPHRAVYELSLANKQHTVSVSGIIGRMVFELTGSPCTGYTQKIRMITKIIDNNKQSTLLDVRANSWEQGDGQVFRFGSKQFSNKKVAKDEASETVPELVSGIARRDRQNNRLAIEIKSPAPVNLELPIDVLFPTQHSLALQLAAKAGKKHLDVNVYDGSEQGQGFYKTHSFIGSRLPRLKKTGVAVQKTKQASENQKLAVLGLSGQASWPVAISYFKITEKHDDAVPVYELSFRMFENGVSSDMLMNYGQFSVNGRLGKIKYLHQEPCDLKR